MKARTNAMPRVAYHPANGSPLTLREVQQDQPAVPLRNLEEFPDAGDLVQYLVRNGSRYVQALEELTDRAGELGDAWERRFKVLSFLARQAMTARRPAPRSGEPETAEGPTEPDTLEELLRTQPWAGGR